MQVAPILNHIEPTQGTPQGPTSGNRQPIRKGSIMPGVELEQLCRNWKEHIRRQQELHSTKLCEMSVTIHRRARALTLSDMCGRYGIRQNTTGRWLDYDQDLDGEIHPINIVGPALNTNQNACLQSNSQTQVAAANQNAHNKQNAMRWQRVADYFERTGWDEAERALIFDAVQKDGTVLIYSYREKVDDKTVAEVREKAMGHGVYKCDSCGMAGIDQFEDIKTEGMQEVPCPQCKQPANAMVTPLTGYDLGEGSVPTYRIVSDIVPFYNFTIDSYGAKIKGIQGAKWLQIQRLRDRMELENDYPGKSFDGGPMSWSYPLRCDYALASGAWDFLNRSSATDSSPEFRRHQENQIYLHEDAYKGWISPKDYEFVNPKGETTFSIKQGQSIPEAQQALYGYNPHGFKFVWIDERLIDIISPETEELNFRECFSDVHWRRDSGSYLSSPNYSIVTIQDDITLLNTMNHNIVARNAVNPVWYNSLVYEEADFSKEYIGAKNAALLGDDQDIRKSVVQMPVPTPSPYLQHQLQFLWSIKDDVTNVTPALRGDAQTGETLGAVRQQLEQSYGGLTSVLKSFAQCKNAVFVQKAKLAIKSYTLEQFQRVGSMFGELWSEQDVAEMCEVNFDEDLIVSYKTGSEMPQSNTDREMRFQQGMTALIPFLTAGVQLPPQALQQIMEKIGEIGGFDFAAIEAEVNEMVAQKRYLDLAQICSQFADITFEQVDEARNHMVAVSEEGQPITALDLMTEQIFAQADIRFSQYENLNSEKDFYVDQLRAETGKTKPNYVLLELLHIILHALEQAQQQLQQQAIANDPQIQAAQAQQQAEQQGQLQQEQMKQQGQQQEVAVNAQMEQQKVAANSQIEQQRLAAQQDMAATGHVADLVKQHTQHHLDLEKAKQQGEIDIKKQKAAPKPKLAPAKK